MTPDDVALKLATGKEARSGAGFSFEEATLVIETLAALNYTFVAPGTAGRFHESDEAMHSMRLFLSRKCGLHYRIIRLITDTLDRLQIRIREPDAHPSGLKTTEPAFANVIQSGAKRAAAQKPIDDRMPGQGRNYA
jgi:hypothetical protein